MELIELKATTRKTMGNGPARALRREGKIPAVLYGPKTEPMLLSVDTRELETAIKTSGMGEVLLNLSVTDVKGAARPVMLKELQKDPVSRVFLHADFLEIDMARKILLKVPVVTVGKSKGVETGGVLQTIRRELEVLCLPLEIPETIEIDITDLDVGDSVHVEDLVLGEGIEIPADVNFTIVTVLSPKVEEIEEEVEEEGEEAEAEGEETSDETPEEGTE